MVLGSQATTLQHTTNPGKNKWKKNWLNVSKVWRTDPKSDGTEEVREEMDFGDALHLTTIIRNGAINYFARPIFRSRRLIQNSTLEIENIDSFLNSIASTCGPAACWTCSDGCSCHRWPPPGPCPAPSSPGRTGDNNKIKINLYTYITYTYIYMSIH